MIEKTMEVDRMEDVISVFGSFDQNLRMIETEYNVRVTDRDEQIHITGEAENVLYAEKAIAGLLSLAAKGEEIGEQNVRYIFRLVREGRETTSFGCGYDLRWNPRRFAYYLVHMQRYFKKFKTYYK